MEPDSWELSPKIPYTFTTYDKQQWRSNFAQVLFNQIQLAKRPSYLCPDRCHYAIVLILRNIISLDSIIQMPWILELSSSLKYPSFFYQTQPDILNHLVFSCVLVRRSVGRSVGWSVGRLVGWSVGWSVSWSVTPSHFWQFRRALEHRVASIGSCYP